MKDFILKLTLLKELIHTTARVKSPVTMTYKENSFTLPKCETRDTVRNRGYREEIAIFNDICKNDN